MSETKKTEAQLLQEKLFAKKKNGFLRMSDEEVASCDAFCEGYKVFMDASKTEREAVDTAIAEAEKKGFRPYKPGEKLNAGDKVYYNNRGKAVILATIGTESLAEGVRIAVAHVDAPRIDLKQWPLYEDAELALFKTHYYGGVKKYQWVAMPLSLHGVIVRKDGSTVKVCIGEDESDPVFCITDLLPHLAQEQMKRPANQIIKGEELNLLVGSRPFRDDDASERVKLGIMKILNEKYDIIEEDFVSAELEIVPAFKAKDIGFDRSMIGAYGHDDRVCGYTALQALFACPNPKKTALAILADKEEVGSNGNTGLQSSFMTYFLTDLGKPHGVDVHTILSHSECLSADVNAAYDPTFGDVLERNNCCYLNKGVCVTKFTGSGGKGGTSDASAEFVGRIRTLLDKEGVIWQTGELGKVDMGGGGTVALYVANLDVEVIDVGVPVLSMHGPYEVVSKIDVYMTYRAFVAFMAD